MLSESCWWLVWPDVLIKSSPKVDKAVLLKKCAFQNIPIRCIFTERRDSGKRQGTRKTDVWVGLCPPLKLPKGKKLKGQQQRI